MKFKFYFLVVFLTGSFTTFSQNFTFVYDDAGNRTDRIIDLSAKSTLQDTSIVNNEFAIEEEIPNEDKFHDQLGSFELLVYPNPTRGEVIVDIFGTENIETLNYKVFDLGGKEIFEGQSSSSQLKIDFSDYVSGAFSLMIVVNGKEKSWKIVKE